jgi:hypothetical protein
MRRWRSAPRPGGGDIAPTTVQQAEKEAGPVPNFPSHASAAEIASIVSAQTRVDLDAQMGKLKAEHAQEMHQLMDEVHKAAVHEVQEAGATEKRKHRIKFAIHSGIFVAGTFLAALAHHYNLPDMASIATELGPLIGIELLDWIKKL